MSGIIKFLQEVLFVIEQIEQAEILNREYIRRIISINRSSDLHTRGRVLCQNTFLHRQGQHPVIIHY